MTIIADRWSVTQVWLYIIIGTEINLVDKNLGNFSNAMFEYYVFGGLWNNSFR